jgi:hypothetical protein
MTPMVSTVEIDRPPEEVFAYVTDPSRFAEWQKNVSAEASRMTARGRWAAGHDDAADRGRRANDDAGGDQARSSQDLVGPWCRRTGSSKRGCHG